MGDGLIVPKIDQPVLRCTVAARLRSNGSAPPRPVRRQSTMAGECGRRPVLTLEAIKIDEDFERGFFGRIRTSDENLRA